MGKKIIIVGILFVGVISCGGGGGGGGGGNGDGDVEIDKVEEGEGIDVDGIEEDGEEVTLDVIDGIDVDGVDLVDADLEEEEITDPARDLCLQLTEAYCGYINRCCTTTEKIILESVIDCGNPESSAYFIECYNSIATFIQNGTAVIYESAIPGCLAMFEDIATSCPDFNSSPFNKKWYVDSGCSEVVRGTLSPNEDCYSHEQCAGNFYCDLESSPSKCTQRKGRGENCTQNYECNTGDVCVLGTCSTPSNEGADCDESDDCNLGFYCNSETQKCESFLETGSNCSSDNDFCSGKCVDEVCLHFCNGI